MKVAIPNSRRMIGANSNGATARRLVHHNSLFGRPLINHSFHRQNNYQNIHNHSSSSVLSSRSSQPHKWHAKRLASQTQSYTVNNKIFVSRVVQRSINMLRPVSAPQSMLIKSRRTPLIISKSSTSPLAGAFPASQQRGYYPLRAMDHSVNLFPKNSENRSIISLSMSSISSNSRKTTTALTPSTLGPAFNQIQLRLKSFERRDFEEQMEEKSGKKGFFRRVMSNLDHFFAPSLEKKRTEELERQVQREKGLIKAKEVVLDASTDINAARQDLGEGAVLDENDKRIKSTKNVSSVEERMRSAQRIEEKMQQQTGPTATAGSVKQHPSSSHPASSQIHQSTLDAKKKPAANTKGTIDFGFQAPQVHKKDLVDLPQSEAAPPEGGQEESTKSSTFTDLGRRLMTGMSKEEVNQMEQSLVSGKFTLNEYRTQLKAALKAQSMGKIGSKFMGWIPGSSKWAESFEQLKGASEMANNDNELTRQIALIDAMSDEERADPTSLEKNAFKRKEQISTSATCTVYELNRLLDAFFIMQATQEYIAELRKQGKPIPNTQAEMMQHFQKVGMPKKLKQRMAAVQKKNMKR